MVACLACDKAIDYSDIKRKTRKFCNDVCRQKYFRVRRKKMLAMLAKKRGVAKVVYVAAPRVFKEPVRKDGEGMIDYLIRLAEWKKLNGIN